MQTQSQTKLSGIKLPEVHDVKKILDINPIPEKQKLKLKLKRVPKLNQE